MNEKEIKLVNLIQPALENEEYELVDLEIKGSHTSPLLRLYIDKDEGVTVRDCAMMSRKISEYLESALSDFQAWRLEVSSPGIDRPLKTEKDFLKNVGRNVTIHYQDGEFHEIEGKILKMQNQKVSIETSEGVVPVALTSIQKAKLKLEW